MTIITTQELDLAYDEDTFAEAATRIQRENKLLAVEIATPGPVLASHGAWPMVTLTGEIADVVVFLRDCYASGDDAEDLAVLRYALGVGAA